MKLEGSSIEKVRIMTEMIKNLGFFKFLLGLT